jgi:hypothetical protein
LKTRTLRFGFGTQKRAPKLGPRPDTQIGEIKKKNSNFLTLPELLRVLTNLIAIAVSGPWRGLQTAQK